MSRLLLACCLISFATLAAAQQEKAVPEVQNIRPTAPVNAPVAAPVNPYREPPLEPGTVKTFFINYRKDARQLQEIVNTMRSVFNVTHVSADASSAAIIVRADPQQLSFAEKLVHELDVPIDTYRLDYTISEIEVGKKVSTHTYTLMCQDNIKSVLKLGSRVPVPTSPAGGSSTNMTYLDVGFNVDAILESNSVGDLTLTSTIEMSSIADSTIAGQGAPVIRQFRTDTKNSVPVGKPVVISTADDVATHRQFQIQVLATKVK